MKNVLVMTLCLLVFSSSVCHNPLCQEIKTKIMQNAFGIKRTVALTFATFAAKNSVNEEQTPSYLCNSEIIEITHQKFNHGTLYCAKLKNGGTIYASYGTDGFSAFQYDTIGFAMLSRQMSSVEVIYKRLAFEYNKAMQEVQAGTKLNNQNLIKISQSQIANCIMYLVTLQNDATIYACHDTKDASYVCSQSVVTSRGIKVDVPLEPQKDNYYSLAALYAQFVEKQSPYHPDIILSID